MLTLVTGEAGAENPLLRKTGCFLSEMHRGFT